MKLRELLMREFDRELSESLQDQLKDAIHNLQKEEFIKEAIQIQMLRNSKKKKR